MDSQSLDCRPEWGEIRQRRHAGQLDQLNRQLNQYQELQSKCFRASSSVRDAQTGYWFELKDHPEIDRHEGSEREFLILGKAFYSQNNLPKDISVQLDRLLSASRWQPAGDERQASELHLVRRSIAVVPEYNPMQHRPPAYPQRAKVAGPEGETIHVDAWGPHQSPLCLPARMIMAMTAARAPSTMTPIPPGWMC